MPAALGGLAASAVGAVVASQFSSALVGAVVGGLVTAGLSSVLGTKPDIPDFDDLTRGLRQNLTNPVEPIPIVYGTTRVGGSRVFADVTGDQNKFLHVVIVWSEGEVESIDTIYIDDVPSTDARFSGLVTVSNHLGTDAQTADASLVSTIGDWTSAHRLRGVAYSYIKMEYDSEVFPRVPVITADITGVEVFNVRTGAINAASTNPADNIYDYLTNTRYGRGIPTSEIDLSSFQDAANACDVTISTPAGNIAKYTCDGRINIDRPSLDNLRDLLTCCRGMLIYTGGKYRLIVDKSESTAHAFTESNIVGEWKVSLDGKTERFNRVRARFVDANRQYQPNIAIQDNTTFRAADNGTLLEQQIQLPFTSNYHRALYIAELELKQSRNSIFVEFTARLDGLRAEVGDVVTITHSTPNWTTKKFRVLAIELDSLDTVRIRAREYEDIYTAGTFPSEPTPPSYTIPQQTPIEDTISLDVEESITWIESFEDGDVSDWSATGNATLTADADAAVGSLAGLFTGTGSAAGDAMRIDFPASFWKAVAVPGRQVRIQFWYKQPGSNASDNSRVLIWNGTDTGSLSVTPTASWQNTGFLFKPTVIGTVLRLYVYPDRDGTDEAVLLDNIVAYVVPDFIDASNIGTWIGSAAIGSAYIASAAITEAKIATAAVTNAKIGTAAVDTLEIAGDAVSNPTFGVNDTVTSLSAGVWTNVVSAGAVPATAGQPVLVTIFGRVSVSGNIKARIYNQSGSVLWRLYETSIPVEYSILGSGVGIFSLAVILYPGASTTFSLYLNASSTPTSSQYCAITATLLKR